MECLETRELLSVTFGDITDYDALRSKYEDLYLSANKDDYNIIELQGSDITKSGLEQAITLAGTTTSDDLIVVRTTATQKTIALTSTISISTSSASMGTNMGKIFIVSLGEDDTRLTINANNRRAFDIRLRADVSFVGIDIINGYVSTNNTSSKITDGNGGAITNIGGYVTLAYSTISNSSVVGKASGGGAIYSESGTLNVIRSTISGNKAIVASGYGGGVYISGGNATFTNSVVTQNEGYYGGGIASANSATVTLLGTTVSDNKTFDTSTKVDIGGQSGGGIYSISSALSIINSSITANLAKVDGGAIHYTKGDSYSPLVIQNSTIADNNALPTSSSSEGGAIYTDSAVTITKSKFEGNRSYRGAAITFYGSSVINLSITDSKFLSNEATAYGGAIENMNTKATLNILRTTFDSNTAGTHHGGAIYNKGIANITDSVFSNNSANEGGAVYTAGLTTISGLSTVFSNNTAHKGSGGAVYFYLPSSTKNITISDAIITGNKAEKSGGGIYAGNYSKISDCTITDNYALADGGGIHIGANSTILSCFIAGNKSDSEGGGVCIVGSNTKIYNSVIAGNYAVSYGGGVYGVPLEVSNSTIVGNRSDKGGGGLYYTSNTATTLKNSIVAGNIAIGTVGAPDIRTASYSTSVNSTSKLTVSYSLIGDNATGTGKGVYNYVGNKINVNPNFVAFTSYSSWNKDRWKSWNLQLNSNSVAINAGNNGLVPTGVTTDVRGIGYKRVMDSGSTVDMGAYEFGNTLVMTAPTGNATVGGNTVTLTWNDTTTARSYEIYRINENNELIGSPLGTTSKANRTWTDQNLPEGTYRYAIIAVNGADRSAIDPDKIIKAVVGGPITIPDVIATVSGNTIILTWEADADATHYLVYRSDALGNDIQVGDVTGTTWSDFGLNPGTYHYAVYSADENNTRTLLGSVDATILPPMPVSPTISATVSESGIVTITWAAIPNAEGYEVSRKLVGSSGTWEKVHDDRLIGTSCIDYLAPEGDVMYIVRAVNAVGSAASDPVTVTIDKPPAAPDLTVTLLDNGRVSLSWTEVAGAMNYEISRQTSSSATIEIINASWYGTSFTDITPPEGNVVYLVRALESVHSSLYGTGGVFVEPQEVTVGKPVVIATVLDNQTVSLMWDDTENATEYVVSRRTVNNPSWLELTTTSGTGFVDTTPPLGTVEYSVTAKHGLSSTKSENVTVSLTLANPVVEASTDVPNEIGLTWDAVPNAVYYSVWVKVGTAAWSRLTPNNNLTGTGYTVTNPPSGSIKYAVKAHNGTLASGMTPVTVDVPLTLNTPVIAAEFQGNTTVSITWNAVTNATGYTIYRRATGTTAWGQVNTTTLTTTSFTDTNVAFGDWDYCVVASNDTVSSADSNVAPVSVTLDAPSTIQASLDSSGVTVTWGAVTQATYYSVWIKAGDAAWAKIANQVSGTSFVDTNPPAGSVKYGVKAHSGSEASARKNTQQALTVPLSPPSTMTASLQNDGTVDLTWNAVTDATSYSVWIKDASGTWTSLVNNVTSTSYTDTAPPTGTVEYAVKAHKGTLTSDLVSDSVNIPLPLSSPVIEAELQSNGTVLVTWDAVDNATGYVVNRRVAGTTTWTQINTGTITTTEFVDTTVPLGDFEYSITALNSSNSADSNVESITVTLCSPVVTADTSDPDKVDLTWNAVNNAGYYSVWIKVGTASWTRLANNVTGTSFTDTSPLNGTTVKYAVKAHNGSLISTMTSTNVNVPALGLPAPSGFAATAATDGSTVDLTWNTVTGATHYSVWIKDSSGTWVSLANNITGTSFTDTAPLTGILEYAVRAHTSTTMSALVTTTVDNSGSSSSASLPPFGAPTLTAVAQSDGTVQLTWNAVADATYYRLFYKIAGVHTAYQVLVTSITELTYLVSGLPSGATVQFGVKAYNGTVLSSMIIQTVTIA